MKASPGGAHKQWGRPQQRGGLRQTLHPHTKQGHPINKGEGVSTQGEGVSTIGAPHNRTPQPCDQTATRRGVPPLAGHH
nr:MAG TPA: hypothetical protein [Caudoviricetes sp.]